MSATPTTDTAMFRRLDKAAAGLEKSIATASKAPQHAVKATDRRVLILWLPLVLVAAIGASALTATGMYFYFGPQISALQTQVNAEAAARGEIRRIAEQASLAAESANAQIESFGGVPVDVPIVGQAPDADVLVSAATAQVLAALPREQPITAAVVAQEVARFMAANPVTPVGPSTGQIADQVAAYLQANPPPQGAQGVPGMDGESIVGPKGDQGEPGIQGEPGEPAPPLTGDEIRAALDAYFLDNPIPPCPDGTALQAVQFGTLGPSGLACVFTGDEGDG